MRRRLALLAVLLVATGYGWAAEAWRTTLIPWVGSDANLAAVLADVGAAHTVMIGEATHGSEEFFAERARLSLALIERLGFEAILVEAPWAPLLAVDAFVRAAADAPPDAATAIAETRSFPHWMVRNRSFLAMIETLRARWRAVRVLGFDLYSLPESARALIAGWRARGKEDEARRAEADLACFFSYPDEPMRYGLAVETAAAMPCGSGARRQLASWAIELAGESSEEAFRLRLHAATVAAAESYYRAIYRGGESSWNVRERHLFAVIETIRRHLIDQGGKGKLIVWAHNTHVGDARATDQGRVGELSLGQLMRERHGNEQVFLLGMTTRVGAVRAADGWGLPDRVMRLRPALPASATGRLGTAKLPAFYLRLRGNPAAAEVFSANLLDRAIGVVYSPQRERRDHYYRVRLAEQFDAVLHLDVSRALEVSP